MLERPLKCLKDFLTLRLTAGRRLLIALSGGGDSLALLYLLLECRIGLNFHLHVAHVDHAWRDESLEESRLLMQLSRQLKLPFHHRRLRALKGANIEDRYREKRYQFFHELQEKWNFQALLLAHHRDDQAETLLKRICEGARLGGLGGLKAESKQKNLMLWRPLLPIQKKELAAYLDSKRITPFDDWTNRDMTYLRPRMRLQIFPDLEKHFGKKIGQNFFRLGSLFQDVATYLEEKKQNIENQLVSGPFGDYLENPSIFPQLEMRFFLEETARKLGAHLSQDSCKTLLRLIEKRASKALIQAKPLTFVLNQHHLFIMKEAFPFFSLNKWEIKCGVLCWKDFWQGFASIPQKRCRILHLQELEPAVRKKVKKWYAKHLVPLFLHDKAPIFVSQGKIVAECLTGCDLSISYLDT